MQAQGRGTSVATKPSSFQTPANVYDMRESIPIGMEKLAMKDKNTVICYSEVGPSHGRLAVTVENASVLRLRQELCQEEAEASSRRVLESLRKTT